MLDRFDIGEEDFVATLRCAAAQTHDAVYAPWGVPELSPDDENFGPMCIDLASVRAWTIAEENYELDSLRFYPEQDGSFYRLPARRLTRRRGPVLRRTACAAAQKSGTAARRSPNTPS